MIARFDHRPMLTAALALATIVLVAVVVTLSTLLYTSAPAVSPTSVSDGNPAAGVVPGNRMDAGGKGYGMPVKAPADPAERMDAGGKGYGMPIEEPAQKGDSVAPHQEIPSAHYGL
jgi:hypothetical protein